MYQEKPRRAFKKAQNMNKIVKFLMEARAELMRVNWPTKQQTINYTITVIGLSIIIALFLGGLDWFFEYLLKTYLLK
jgi:preprotein translocase subunit SecE